MARREIHIHAGLPKTGTSALQAFLAANRERLSDRGVILPGIGLGPRGDHHDLMFALGGLNRRARRDAIAGLRDERQGTLLVSSEFAYLMVRYAFGGRGFRALRDAGFDPVFHLFVRPQPDFAVSAHPEYLRNLLLPVPFDRFLTRNFLPFAADYRRIVARLDRLSPGNVRVIPYSRANRQRGVWWSLLESMGVAAEQNTFAPAGEVNPSLGPIGVAALTSALQQVQPNRWNARMHLRHAVLNVTRTFGSEEARYNPLSPEDRKKLWEKCRPANDAFATAHWRQPWDSVFAEEAATDTPVSVFDPAAAANDDPRLHVYRSHVEHLVRDMRTGLDRLARPRPFKLRRALGRPVDIAADRVLRLIATGRP